MATDEFTLAHDGGVLFLTLTSADNTNCLTRPKVRVLREEIENFRTGDGPVLPLVISGRPVFSFGADLREIDPLTASEAFEFARMGQALMRTIETYPAPVYAALEGYCMGGGLDLAMACHRRIAAPGTIFGHRGAALGLMTGWGGTQRLPRLVGRARALQILATAETMTAPQALEIGLIDGIAEDPVTDAARRISEMR